MSANNSWSGRGNLTRDPEVRKAGEHKVTGFGIAVTTRYNKDPDKKEVLFLEGEAWNGRGEFMAEHCRKGDAVGLEGELVLDSWTDKESGEKRSRMKLRVNDIDPIKLAEWEDGASPKKVTTAAPKKAGKAAKPEPEDEEEEEEEEKPKKASKKAAKPEPAKKGKKGKPAPEPEPEDEDEDAEDADDDDDDDDDADLTF